MSRRVFGGTLRLNLDALQPIAAAVAPAVARGLGPDKGYWVVITVAVVVEPQLSLSVGSTVLRVLGTFVGAVLGIGPAIACTSRPALIAALFVLTALPPLPSCPEVRTSAGATLIRYNSNHSRPARLLHGAVGWSRTRWPPMAAAG